MSDSGKVMVAVKIDRCWNRHWRLLLFLGAVLMSCITGAMWMSMQRQRMTDELLKTDWQDHWQKQQLGSASKTVFEQPKDDNQPGINIEEDDQSFQEYMEDDRDPMPDEPDYYDADRPDVKDNRVNNDYIAEYHDEMRTAQVNKTPAQKLLDRYHPVLRNYSLVPELNNPFKFFPQDKDIKFIASYDNPCWAEVVPRFPYQNNSYLMVSEQARVIEPMFQAMRKRFAHQDPDSKWRVRCLPAFYVMETPPLATPSLFTVLGYHPQIVASQMNEPEYWNHKGPDGVASFRDYLDLFDTAAYEIRENVTRVRNEDGSGFSLRHNKLTGDGTSSYLWTFDSWNKVTGNEGETEPKVTAADMIFKLTPLAKFIFVLRNPTDRLFQGYLSRTDSPSAADFHEKAGQAMDRITKCEKTNSLRNCLYNGPLNKGLPVRLRIGMYYPFLADWLRVFPADQIKVIRYEDYVESPSKIINEACRFLGLSPFPTKDIELVEQRVQSTEAKRKAGQKVKMLSTTRAMLKEFHRILNQELATLLGDEEFTWPKLATPLEPSSSDGSAANTEPKQPTAEEVALKQQKEKDFQAEKEKARALIQEVRAKQLLDQREKMAQYRQKMSKWAEEQRERRLKQEEERKKAGGDPARQGMGSEQGGRPGNEQGGRPGNEQGRRPGNEQGGRSGNEQGRRPGNEQGEEQRRREMMRDEFNRRREGMRSDGENRRLGGARLTPGQPPMGQPPVSNEIQQQQRSQQQQQQQQQQRQQQQQSRK